MSLRRRVLLGFVLVAVALVVTNGALASAFEDDLVDRTDQELVETANRPVFRRTGVGRLEPLSDLYIAAAELDGSGLRRLGRSLDESQSPPSPSPAQLVDHAADPSAPQAFTAPSADGESSWRVAVVTGRLEGGLLVVATELDQVEATLRRMRTIQLLGSAAVLAALAAVSWWVLRLGVRPLVTMAATADEIAGGDLARRVEHVDDRTEAGRLGTAFNSMLDRIQAAFREREASEAMLRQFAADASHELRTPLTSIRGYAELWEAGGLRDPADLEQAMRRLSEEGRRMGTLVDDLLLLARLDQQRPIDREPVRIDRLALDGVADARAVEPDRPISVSTVPALVLGDELRLRQIVANLLANARVHTPPGAGIQVEVSAEGSMVRLEVADEGPGMPPDVAERAFERFYRADGSRARASGGSGLGLSIVQAVARAHGGRARVATSPGAGTRVIVELPASPPDVQAPPSQLQGEPPTLEP